MKLVINQEQRAYSAWEILIRYAHNNQTITYSLLAEEMEVHHRAIRFVLDLIYDYCVADNNLPLLTGIVVNKHTNKPGMGFTDFDGSNFEIELNKIFSFPWQNFQNPFEFARDGSSAKILIDTLIDSPDDAEIVYTKVKVRGVTQMIFRGALLEAYDYSCAICGLTFQEALEACHIIPYSQCNYQQKLDVRNGLLLCSTHHKFFDYGFITVDDNYKIKYSDMEEHLEPYSDYDRLLTKYFNNRLLLLPKNEKHLPNKNYLRQHSMLF